MNEESESFKPPMTEPQIRELIKNENYPIENRVMSRCIDGRYTSDESLPALAIPGADMGQMVMLFVAANRMGLKLNVDKAFNALIDVVGGVKNIRIHTDDSGHTDQTKIADGCGYFKYVCDSPENFGVKNGLIDTLKTKFEKLISEGAKQEVLSGKHTEQAILMVSGDSGIQPNGDFFVYHHTLVDERNKALVDKVFELKAIEGINYESKLAELQKKHLSESLKEVTQIHLGLTVEKLAAGKPVFEVNFLKDNVFTLIKK